MTTKRRTLGKSGIEISTIGLGCMGLSEFYGPPTEERDAIALLHKAVDLGVDHFDTAEMYGMGHNESLLGKAFDGRWGDITFATKFGPLRDPETGAFTGVDGSRANVRRAVEGSLKRLGADTIDLYYLHRVDPDTPIEETVAAIAELVQEGKVRTLGLSEASAETLRRACEVHPITALQTEYSITSRDVEADILPACVELGVSLVAYSPLGRGLLTGRYQSGGSRPNGAADFRSAMLPRFSEENFGANLKLVEVVKSVAERVGASPSQVALAWVLHQGEHIVTIPGTTKLRHLEANLGALDVALSDDDLATLAELSSQVKGDRYNEMGMSMIEG
jgi:aryl-alcohol dehydrogenase-like predicted oxidoreductase